MTTFNAVAIMQNTSHFQGRKHRGTGRIRQARTLQETLVSSTHIDLEVVSMIPMVGVAGVPI